ncbi:MAG: PhzF family phenazine biosynthesis protein [Pseudomonadota bacterium]
MTQEIALYQVDAFAERPFTGNPAAVCPLEDWLPDEILQAIAMENNLAETAFIVPDGDDYKLRWFTPAIEVDLCGHATLASGYVVSTLLEPGRERVTFHSRSGPLTVARDGERFAMDFPARRPTPWDALDQVEAAIGIRPQALLSADKGLAVLASQAEVLAVVPNFPRIEALPVKDGLIITAPGEDCDFVSRYFAPHAGIPEDPVTGSAHCVLTPYWAERLGKSKLTARQVSARGGQLEVEDRGERIGLTGRVAPYLEGKIRVPR